jgi:hypothetical protein
MYRGLVSAGMGVQPAGNASAGRRVWREEIANLPTFSGPPVHCSFVGVRLMPRPPALSVWRNNVDAHLADNGHLAAIAGTTDKE